MEEAAKPYGILQSRTIHWLAGEGVSRVCRLAVVYFGLTLDVPSEVQIEIVAGLLAALEVAGGIMTIVAGYFRVKATKIIEGWRP